MQHVPFGRTGVTVSNLCLGTMMFGEWGNPDHDESVRIIHAALDAGINFVDTADVYSAGESEEIVGKALEGRRDDVVLATKFHSTMGSDPNHRGNSRRWVVQEVEASLKRLRTDWIDLYQVHRPEPGVTDHDETLSALTDLQRQGKIRYVGSSTFPAHEVVDAQWVARDRHLARYVSEQPQYSIFARAIERDVLPVTERFDMAVIPWSPLAGGWLTGRYRTGMDQPTGFRAERMKARYDLSTPENQRKLQAADQLIELADEAGLSMVELALGFVLAHPAVTAPIIGPRTMEQLTTQLGATDVVLSADVLDRIDEIVPPGTNLDGVDAGWVPPSIADASLRRRPAAVAQRALAPA